MNNISKIYVGERANYGCNGKVISPLKIALPIANAKDGTRFDFLEVRPIVGICDISKSKGTYTCDSYGNQLDFWCYNYNID